MWWPPVLMLVVLAASIVFVNVRYRRGRAALTQEQRAEDDKQAKEDLQTW